MQLPDQRELPKDVTDAVWEPVPEETAPAFDVNTPKRFKRDQPHWWLHGLLFGLTAWTCYRAAGWYYSIGLMAILLAHETGHYVMSLRWRVRATPPFFLPFPDVPGVVESPLGTLGAVISMKSPVPNKRALLDIGATGPISGMVVALAVAMVGLHFSTIEVVPARLPAGTGMYVFGDSLLFSALRYVILGPVPAGYDVFLHPLARAGWVGFFVTALNLLPIGQLDGGHVLYALHQKHYRVVVRLATAALIALILVSPVWILFALMAGIFGQTHPPPLDSYTPVDRKRRLLGYLCAAILVACFMPDPIDLKVF
ncbi:MAG: Peptidase family M50 [Candidatus Latescibacteria bacterium ADurb.Bin168]|nr:MAG: Peptidase family M50 [Candidatus Latescibacteria bacterium ADurb.Bin168]